MSLASLETDEQVPKRSLLQNVEVVLQSEEAGESTQMELEASMIEGFDEFNLLEELKKYEFKYSCRAYVNFVSQV